MLFVAGRIWQDAASGMLIDNLAAKYYAKLKADAALEWTLEAACEEHKQEHSHKHCMFAKPHGDIFEFYAERLPFAAR